MFEMTHRFGTIARPGAVALMLAVGVRVAAGQTIVYVDGQAEGGNNGTSWADAYTDLQAGLADARQRPGQVEEIWVAAGTYRPAGLNGDRELGFALVDGVGLYGGFAGGEQQRDERDPRINVTILSGDLNGDDDDPDGSSAENSYHVVTVFLAERQPVLDGFTIRGGNADSGGCINCNRGGGLFNFGGNPRVIDCIFFRNRAFSGAAIFNLAGEVLVDGCAFRVNSAETAGGALFNEAQRVEIRDCDFEDNTARSGGAVYSEDGELNILESRLARNTSNTGGGIFNLRSQLILSESTLRENQAISGDGGGGLHNIHSEATVSGCVFEANSTGNQNARTGGGLLHQGDGAMELQGCTFTDNTGELGGGLFASAPIVISECTFRQNLAAKGGGLALATADGMSMRDCTIEDNRARSEGGGLYISRSAPMPVTDCTFTRNTATRGGGVMVDFNDGTRFKQCTFHANVSSGSGGGLLNNGSDSLLFNCAFFGNEAFFGGGVANLRGSSAQLVNCLFSGNEAEERGGGLGNGDSVPTVSHCTFSRNLALALGGAISSSSVMTRIDNSVLWRNIDGSGFGPTSQISGTATVKYCCVMNGWPAGAGIITADPLFADADGPDDVYGTTDDDLRPTDPSPCIDAGGNSFLPTDAADLDGDDELHERLPLDFARQPRLSDRPDVADGGVGGWPVADIGAFENADCNVNGHPDAEDIANQVSDDCNLNGVPDECELRRHDCNGNTIPDDCEDPRPRCGQSLYALAGADTSNLYRIERYAFAPRGIRIGSAGEALTDLAVDPQSGVIYATDGRSLYQLNTQSGAAELIGALGAVDQQGLEFDRFGQLYSWGSQLRRVDKRTGQSSAVGSSFVSEPSDMAFGIAGTLFGASVTELYQLNTLNGRGTRVAPFEAVPVWGMDIDTDNASYASVGDGDLLCLDGASGRMALVGGVAGIDPEDTITGLAFVLTPLRGDLNDDGRADLLDAARFMLCFTGEDGGPVAPECGKADADHDDDVDLADYALHFAEMTGP